MIRLSKEKVLLLQKLLIEETGGSFGLRDEALLESALEGIYAAFDGQELYPAKEEKGARLGYSLITIVLDGQQIDLLELSSISRTQILLQLHAGSTEGELYELEEGEKMALRQLRRWIPSGSTAALLCTEVTGGRSGCI